MPRKDVQRTTFRARLKHFRKLGIPQRQPGKGEPASDNRPEIFQLMLACEFAEFGINPHLITDIVHRHWRMKGQPESPPSTTLRGFSVKMSAMIFTSPSKRNLCLGTGIGRRSNIVLPRFLYVWLLSLFAFKPSRRVTIRRFLRH